MSVRRADLLALTPAALASLANMGLVKRAQKELDAGKGPQLEVGTDGAIRGLFDDGVQATLVVGKGLADSPCSCGASTVCRHRVAVVLAYQQQADAAPAPAASSPPTAVPERPWSPGSVSDEALAAAFGARTVERADRLRQRGYLAEVRRDELPVAQLATSTVRFLVPGDIGFARCDCTQRTGCEHVVLAVWAFRAADDKDAEATALTVAVSTSKGVAGALLDDGLGVAGDLVAELLLDGAAHTSPAAGARFSLARAALERQRAAWPLDAVDDLELLVEAYRKHSARYTPLAFAHGVLEVWARRRAAARGTLLPAASILGTDEAHETRLDRLRLVGLGARIEAFGNERSAEIFFCEPGSGSIVVVRRNWSFADGEQPEDGPTLGQRLMLGGRLSDVAGGQLVTTAATRKPNRLVTFGSGPLAKTSLLKQTGDFSALPSSVLVSDVAAHLEERQARPPRFLRPRLLAENVKCLALGAVDVVAYDPAAQAVRAQVRDPRGHAFLIERSFRGIAPGALEALVEALGKGATFVVGDLHKDERGLVVEPLAVVAEGVVVLDTAPSSAAGRAALASLPLAQAPARSRTAQALGSAADVVADLAHQGLRHATPATRARVVDRARELEDFGLQKLAADLRSLASAHDQARTSGRAEDEVSLVDAWAHAAARLWVARERV